MYWTIEIPYQAAFTSNVWMPTEPSGPFSTLTRGAFKSNAEAVAWAEANLPAGAKRRFKQIKA